MTLDWELLIDAEMDEQDWQFSAPTTATLLRIDQENAPDIGRFALGQATIAEFEFLDIKAYPARAESTRITLDAVGEANRRLAIRYRYAQFPEGTPNTWRIKVYGSELPFEPAINPAAIVLTLDPRIAGAIPLEEKGIPLGVATLDADGIVPDAQLLGSGLADLVAANMEAVDALADQVSSIPPFPTLASLGAEPIGAETRAKTYTDEEILQIQEELNMAIANAIGNAFKAGVQFVLGSDAPGDIYFRSASGPLARLGIGSNGQALVVNSGLPAWANQTTLSWATVTATSQAAAINTGYIINAATLCTVTLPTTAAVGSLLEIVGVGAGGWRLGQGASQQVVFGNISNTSGAGGQLNSTHQRDAIRLVCITADTTWQVISSIGNIDVI